MGYNNVDNGKHPVWRVHVPTRGGGSSFVWLSGYARFDHVRVPRFNMLAKHQSVTREGEYVKKSALKSTKSDVADKIKCVCVYEDVRVCV